MDWHPVISVQQQTPDNDFCHFSISNVRFAFWAFFSKTGKTRVSHRVKMMTRWPARERWPKWPIDPVTQWPSSISARNTTAANETAKYQPARSGWQAGHRLPRPCYARTDGQPEDIMPPRSTESAAEAYSTKNLYVFLKDHSHRSALVKNLSECTHHSNSHISAGLWPRTTYHCYYMYLHSLFYMYRLSSTIILSRLASLTRLPFVNHY